MCTHVTNVQEISMSAAVAAHDSATNETGQNKS